MLVLLVGLVFSLTQAMRGAHYPSHSLWTAWVCWVLGQLVYRRTCPRS
jgi:membrane-associated PAP2 superfamily phosphatase